MIRLGRGGGRRLGILRLRSRLLTGNHLLLVGLLLFGGGLRISSANLRAW